MFKRILCNKRFYQSKVDFCYEKNSLFMLLKNPLANNESQKLFIKSDYKFSDLKDIFLIENCNIDFKIIDKNSNKEIDYNTNINDFVYDFDSKMYTIIIDDIFNLNMNNIMKDNESINRLLDNEATNINLFNKLDDDSTNDQLLKNYFIVHNKFIDNLEKYNKENITEDDLNYMLDKSITKLKHKTYLSNQKLQFELNEVKSEIENLKKEKNNIYRKSNIITKLYIYLIFILTVIQFGAFYYMIYEVDFLGWDIVEPITYSVYCISLLLSIRFFSKYNKTKSFDAISEIFRSKIHLKDPNIHNKIVNLDNNILKLESRYKNLNNILKI